MRQLLNIILTSVGFTMLLSAFPFFSEAAVWTVAPTLNLRGEYNDNIGFSSESKQRGFGYNISPSLTMQTASDRLNTTGTLSANIQRYDQQKTLNTESYLFRLAPQYRMEYGLFQLNTAYRRDTTLQNELEVTGLVLERREQSRMTINPVWNGSITEHLSLEVAYQFSRTDLPQGERPGLFEFQNHQGTLDLSYALTEKDQLDINLSHASFRVPSFAFRSNTTSAQLGIRHRFSETFDFSLLLGGYYTQQKGIGINDRKKEFTLSGNVAKQFEKTQVSVNISRSVNPSSSGSLLQGDRLSISMIRRLAANLSGSVSASFSQNRFLRPDETRRKSRFYRISPALNWQLAERWRMSTAYSYSRQTSDGSFGSVRANTATVNLLYQFKNRVFSP